MTQKYIPYQVVWETTLRCNLKCIHCGSSAGKSRLNELTTEEGEKLIRDLAEIGTREVCFMGGEPFLREDWYELGKLVRDLGMDFVVISNGFIVDQNIIDKLAKLETRAVSASLDGAKAETHDYIRGKGSFERVMNYIALSKKSDLPTTVITTLSKINYKELPAIKNFLLNKQIAWQIQVGAPSGRFKKDMMLSKEEYYTVAAYIATLQKKYSRRELPVIGAHCFGYHSYFIPCLGLYPDWIGCQAGITILSIKSNGDVIGCLSAPTSAIEGNIRKKSIIEIWKDPKGFAYNRNFKIDNIGKNCKGCKYAETCRGGCLGMSTSLTDKYHNDPYCLYKIENGL